MEKHTLERPQLESASSEFAPRLIIEAEPGYRVFFRNLGDMLFPRRAIRHQHGPEWPEFWSDVFVSTRLPWWQFVESFAVHLLLIAAVWSASRVWLLRAQMVPPTVFSKNDVIYFPASEYLPPLDTGKRTLAKAHKGEPEYSRQTIISVPPEADNRTQTVVTPPDIKLRNEVPLPNIVAWKNIDPAVPISAASSLKLPLQQPLEAIAPAPALEQAADRRRLQVTTEAVIAPPPEVAEVNSRRATSLPRAAIIEPPPAVQGQIRQFGEINIGHSEIVPPAPELSMHEQRAISYETAALSGSIAAVVPPPPSVHRAGISEMGSRGGASSYANVVPPPPSIQGAARSQNRIVALGLHPVAGAPPVALGNRRGSFATSPSGKIGAPGTPDIKSGTHAGSSATGNGSRSGRPSGLLVQPGPPSSTGVGVGDPGSSSPTALIADAKQPVRVGAAPRRALESTSPSTAEEREVFGDRKLYSMSLNMPNLNSAGGSWIIRFAELNNDAPTGDLIAPELTRKVDPAYPLELMRTQIEGKVTLFAVIHSDGHVGDVRVLSSVDERLDAYACTALSRWIFRPAIRAGTPVALQAVITIPFRARRAF
jgi:TonB family protein